MAKVIITQSLVDDILRKFKQESEEIFQLMKTLEDSPKKGKALGSVGGIVIKELKYKAFRFYFITDGHILKFGTEDEFANLLIRFVRMSEKKDQEKVIAEIKDVLRSFGMDSFE
jgi:hypothetical protein